VASDRTPDGQLSCAIAPGAGWIRRVGDVVVHGRSPFTPALADVLAGTVSGDVAATMRALAALLLRTGPDSISPVACVGVDGDGVRALVAGDISVSIVTDRQHGVVDGADAVTWAEQRFAGALVGAQCGDWESAASSGFRLDDGLVPASAFVLGVAETAAPSRDVPVEEPVAVEPLVPEPVVVPMEPVVEPSLPDEVDGSMTVWPVHGLSELVAEPAPEPMAEIPVVVDGDPVWQPAEPPREPAPTLTWKPADDPPAANGVEPDYDDTSTVAASQVRSLLATVLPPASGASSTVMGLRCERLHMNPLGATACPCGAPLDWGTGPVEGDRPSLGVVTFDDGRRSTLTRSTLVGRLPEPSAAEMGAVDVIAVNDPEREVSRTHFEIRLVDWTINVVDRASPNGTQIRRPDGRLIDAVPNVPTPITAGDVVVFGTRTMELRAPEPPS
jgi:hypothetical protein